MRRVALAALLGLAGCVASPTGPELRLVDDAFFELAGIDARVFDANSDPQTLLRVYVADAGEDAPPLLGGYERRPGRTIRFVPRFRLAHGVRYRAVGPTDERMFAIAPSDAPRVAVRQVYPSGDVLPENLLRFYVHFTGPVAKGNVYEYIRVLDDRDRPLDLPFIEIAEELWDPTGTRLTLLLDPGRIKNELRPRLEDGPVLHAGRDYTLRIDPKWPDVAGRPLLAPFSKRFRTSPVDSIQPDPGKWTMSTPRRGKREPLEVRFLAPLDHALLHRMIAVHDASGELVEGEIRVDDAERRWRFLPSAPWGSGEHRLVVDTDLEDQVGNSIRMPFEVDVVRAHTRRVEKRFVRLPITFR